MTNTPYDLTTAPAEGYGFELSEDLIELARALGLVVVRESDEHNVELFNGMREQTYRAYASISELQAIRKLGMMPLTCGGSFTILEEHDGRSVEVVVLVEQLRYGNTRAILFCYRGYWHLWSQSSAARVTMQGVNEFTEILVDALIRIRPKTLFTANISRLVRSQKQAMRLKPALCENVDEIRAGTMNFQLGGAEGFVGSLLLDVLVMASAMERDWIVQRMICGKVAKWRRGEWPFGPLSVPFGYRVDATTHKLVPQPELKPVVREMLLILSKSLPPSEAQRQLAAAGVLTARKNKVLGRRTSVDALRDPSSLVTMLYSWAGVWVSGEFLHRLTNGFKYIDDLNGVPIMRSGVGDPGELQMLVKVAVPEGGWADPEILMAFQKSALEHSAQLVGGGKTSQRPLSNVVRETSVNDTLHEALLNKLRAVGQDAAARVRHTAAQAKKTVSPLMGRVWSDGSAEFALQPMSGGKYQLFSWPAGEERGPLNWWSNARNGADDTGADDTGADDDGADDDGADDDGADDDGADDDGADDDGAAHDGADDDGAAHDGAAHDGAAHDGVDQS